MWDELTWRRIKSPLIGPGGVGHLPWIIFICILNAMQL